MSSHAGQVMAPLGGTLAESALDALPEPLCLLNTDGVVEWVNRAWRDFGRARGAPPGDFVGTNYLGVGAALAGPDGERLERFRTALRDVLSGQRTSASLEYPCHGPVERAWYLATARRCGEGEHARVLVTHVDVTARRDAEEREALASEAHRQISGLASCLPGVVFQFRTLPGGKHVFEFISGALEALFELGPEEVQQDDRALLKLVHPDDLVHINENLKPEAQGPRHVRLEYRVVLPRRGLRWHSVDTVFEKTPDGDVLWQGYISDVTERRESEGALRESEANLRAVLENVRHAFMLLEPDHTLRFFNRTASNAAQAVTGRPLEPGASIDGWLAPGEREVFAAEVRRAMAGERVVTLTRQPTPAGEVAFELDFSPVRDPAGQVRGVFYGALDISERLRLEEAQRELDRRHQQAVKHESLEAMAGGIAHQFNNLLAVIQGNLELSRLDAKPGVEALLGEAGDAVRRAAVISGSLLSYLGQGSRPREPRPLDAELQAVVPALRAALPGNVRLEVTVPVGLPWCTMDRSALHQVLHNLVTNAAEAMDPRGGTVSLCGTLADAGPGARTWSCVEVADDGHGMEPHTLERAFDPFFSTRFTGRGLGLSVAQGLVRAHGGRLELVSVPGKGTRALVWLPAAPEGDQAQRAEARPPQTTRTPRPGPVLVVDDDPAVLRSTRRLLAGLGHDVVTAASGVEALELFRARTDSIGAVVLDLNMPDLDGWAVLEAIRKARPDTWVVVASGYDVSQLRNEARAVEPDAWLQKPFDAEELGRLLRAPAD